MLTAKNEGSERIVISAGTHVARCYGIIDLGTQYSERFGNSTRKVQIQWELPNELMDDGRPLAISKRYTLSVNEKANLRKDLESWLGRGITIEEEKNGFALGGMLGAPCLLSIIHAESNGKTFANIAAVMSVPKGTKVPCQFNPAVSYDVENGKDATFEQLPEWIRTIIEQSKEFKGEEEPELPTMHRIEPSEAAQELLDREGIDNITPFNFEDGPLTPKQLSKLKSIYIGGKVSHEEFGVLLAGYAVLKADNLTESQANELINSLEAVQ